MIHVSIIENESIALIEHVIGKAVALASKEFIRGFLLGQALLLLLMVALVRFLFLRGRSGNGENSKKKSVHINFKSIQSVSSRENNEQVTRESLIWANRFGTKILWPFMRSTLKYKIIECLNQLNEHSGNSRLLSSNDGGIRIGPIAVESIGIWNGDPVLDWVESGGAPDRLLSVKFEWKQSVLNTESNFVAEMEAETAVNFCWPPNHHGSTVASLPCSFKFSIISVEAIINVCVENENNLVSFDDVSKEGKSLFAENRSQEGSSSYNEGLNLDKKVISPPEKSIDSNYFVPKLSEKSKEDFEKFGNIYLTIPRESFFLNLDIHTLVGHHSHLRDIPKLTEMISLRIKNLISKHLVSPQKFPLRI